MSEPLGGISDHMASSVYCTETPLPILEEERKNNGESNENLEYYFRDSFDHSSSESGFTNVENRIGTTHLHHRQNFNASETIPPLALHIVNQQNATNSAKNMKKFSIVHAFMVSFIFVVIVLVISAICILESDSHMLSGVRNLPEMVSLRYQYYQPMKEFILKTIESIF